MTKLLVHPEKCTGCLSCVEGCSAKHEGAVDPELARIAVNAYPYQDFFVPSICFHCMRPECLSACPERAIFRGYEDVILADHNR